MIFVDLFYLFLFIYYPNFSPAFMLPTSPRWPSKIHFLLLTLMKEAVNTKLIPTKPCATYHPIVGWPTATLNLLHQPLLAKTGVFKHFEKLYPRHYHTNNWFYFHTIFPQHTVPCHLSCHEVLCMVKAPDVLYTNRWHLSSLTDIHTGKKQYMSLLPFIK